MQEVQAYERLDSSNLAANWNDIAIFWNDISFKNDPGFDKISISDQAVTEVSITNPTYTEVTING
tara:strand:+ start:2154 stop:2348 length:195 start_codon:yes stop_codon:yes gene_type:complete